MKIGLYGGTFNPIHRGHIHILNAFTEILELGRILVMPTAEPPHKRARTLAPGADRLRMCQIAAEQVTGAEVLVSDLELRRGGRSYSSDTLRELQARYPGDTLHFLMGEDMFLTVQNWHEAETVMKLTVLCASPRSADGLLRLREHGKYLETRFGASVRIADIPYMPVSSTEIREKIGRGEDAAGLLPPGVADYIKKRRLYQAGEETGC